MDERLIFGTAAFNLDCAHSEKGRDDCIARGEMTANRQPAPVLHSTLVPFGVQLECVLLRITLRSPHPCTHTCTHAPYAHTPTSIHRHTHTCTHSYTLSFCLLSVSHTHTHLRIHTYTHANIHTHSLSLCFSLTHTRPRSRLRSHSRVCTTHTYTDEHLPSHQDHPLTPPALTFSCARKRSLTKTHKETPTGVEQAHREGKRCQE